MRLPLSLSPRAHDVLGYAGPFSLSMALGLTLWVTGFDDVTGTATASPPVRFGILGTVALASAFRRRAPAVALAVAAAATAADAVAGPSLAVWLIASDVLYAAALYGGRRLSRAVVTAGAVGSVLTVCVVAYEAADARTVGFAVLLLAAFVATPLWWGRSVRSYRRIAELERDRAQALRTLADRDRTAAVTAERDRMARDLHDAIAAHLSAVSLQANAAGRLLDGRGDTDPRLRATVDAIRRGSSEALAEMRSMIDLLQAPEGESTRAAGGLDRLDLLVDSARAAGVPVDLSVSNGTTLPTTVDLAVFRIVAEALANVTRHAPGATTEVTVRHAPQPDRVILTVHNARPRNPAGHAPDTASGGDGLRNMRWRAEMLGGTFSAGPQGDGWEVRAVLPCTDIVPAPDVRETL